MSNTYFQNVKEAVDVLSEDEELMFEEKIILLDLMDSYVAMVREKLEKENRDCK